MIKSIIISLLILWSIHAESQIKREILISTDSTSVLKKDTTLSFLEIGNRIYCEGFGGMVPKPVVNFEKFLFYTQHYSIDSIIKYSDSKYNLSLRVYSIWALLLRKYEAADIIAKELLLSKEEVLYNCGCISNQNFPVNQFIYLLFSGKIDTSIKHIKKSKLREINSRYNPGTSKVMQPCFVDLKDIK